jgi:hypothetical protein
MTRSGDATSPTTDSRWRWVPWIIISVALALRFAHLWIMRDTALVRYPTIDPGAYLARAEEILAGKWWPNDVFFQDPLYPYLLAAMKWCSHGSLWGAYAGHGIASSVSCWLVFLLARRYVNPWAGAIAGLAAAAYAPSLYLDGQLEKNTFTVLTLLGALVAFPSGADARLRRIAGSGVLLGLGALLRGNYLLLAPLWAAFLWFLEGGAPIPKRLLRVAVFACAVCAPIAPFTIHNWIVSKTFVLTTAQAGTAFYLGNNPENASGGIHAVSFNRQVPDFEADDWKREADRRTGQALSRNEVSAFWFGQALQHITKDPGFGWWLSLVSKKAELIVNRIEVPDNSAMAYVERLSPLVGRNPIRFATVAPLGLAGLVLFLIYRSGRGLFLATTAAYGATLLLFPVSDRFRAPFATCLLIASGASCAYGLDWLRARAWPRVAALAVLAGGFAILVNHEPWLQPADTNLREQNALLKAYHDDANAFINHKQWDRAEAVLQEAMGDEWFARKARLVLDMAFVRWYKYGDAAGARDLATKSVGSLLKQNISSPDGYLLLSEILAAGGDRDGAAYWAGRAEAANTNDWQQTLAVAFGSADRGDRGRATGILDEYVVADRRSPAQQVHGDAYIRLARLQLQNGQRARAAETVKALQRMGGPIPVDLIPLAEIK